MSTSTKKGRSGDFFREHLLGIFILGVVTSIVASVVYDWYRSPKEVKSAATPPSATPQPSPTGSVEPKSELDLVLDSCSHVPPGVARFVVIPATPGRVKHPEYTLTFTGLLGDRVAATRYAVLRNGLDIGALRIYPRRYTILLADPESNQLIASFSSSGVASFDVEKHRVEEARVAFLDADQPQDSVNWDTGATTAALDGRCNLLNLVILPSSPD